MKNSKPSKLCGGCKLYGDKCHCLCHKSDIVEGYHEILFETPFQKANLFQKISNKLLRNNRI